MDFNMIILKNFHMAFDEYTSYTYHGEREEAIKKLGPEPGDTFPENHYKPDIEFLNLMLSDDKLVESYRNGPGLDELGYFILSWDNTPKYYHMCWEGSNSD